MPKSTCTPKIKEGKGVLLYPVAALQSRPEGFYKNTRSAFHFQSTNWSVASNRNHWAIHLNEHPVKYLHEGGVQEIKLQFYWVEIHHRSIC